MNHHLTQLKSALAATVIHPRGGYSWFGERSPALSASLRRVLPDGGSDAFLVHTLQARLYTDFYCRGAAGQPRPIPVVPRLRTTPFVEQLSAAGRRLVDEASGRGTAAPGSVVIQSTRLMVASV